MKKILWMSIFLEIGVVGAAIVPINNYKPSEDKIRYDELTDDEKACVDIVKSYHDFEAFKMSGLNRALAKVISI